IGLRVPEPLKMTSAISLPRRLLTLCSPSTHLIASTTFDLPEPLGPTTTVMPGGNSKRVLSAKLLKPMSSRALSIGGQQRVEDDGRCGAVRGAARQRPAGPLLGPDKALFYSRSAQQKTADAAQTAGFHEN